MAVLIALRDDAELLHDAGNLFLSDATHAPGEVNERASDWTPYSEGFSARRFIAVIEEDAVWQSVNAGL